jgi:putative restriction endonuclease
MISGQKFQSRKELYDAGLHNSHQKGIGRAKDGSNLMSIVLSGGYVDDEDYGDVIIYTGEGGRDPKSGNQIANQTLKAGNLGLLKAFESGQPVYVTRGATHKSSYSPKEGYEFAGKYFIQEHWVEKGKSGFDIIRFKLARVESRLAKPIPEQYEDTSSADRVEFISTRIIRDTKISNQVKEIYDYSCQVFGSIIELPSGGRYAEGAHIKPLGTPHNGPDNIQNILCLCPNHHLMFDRYALSINPDNLTLEGVVQGTLNVNDQHDLNRVYVRYHWENYLNHK